MLLTCFQAAPVNVLKEWVILELCALIIFEPEAFHWVLLQQAFTNTFAVFAEGGRVRSWIIQDSASHLSILNLNEPKTTFCKTESMNEGMM